MSYMSYMQEMKEEVNRHLTLSVLISSYIIWKIHEPNKAP